MGTTEKAGLCYISILRRLPTRIEPASIKGLFSRRERSIPPVEVAKALLPVPPRTRKPQPGGFFLAGSQDEFFNRQVQLPADSKQSLYPKASKASRNNSRTRIGNGPCPLVQFSL